MNTSTRLTRIAGRRISRWLWPMWTMVIGAALACGSLPFGSDNNATAVAFGAALEATRAADSANSTAAAAVTATVKALPTTPGPTATAFPSRTPDSAATQSAEATLSPIRAALAGYGVDPNKGFLGWAHAPKTIEIRTYLAQDYATDYPNVITRNFVVQADVTWETRTGLAGCGFVFRADQEKNFYGMGVARGATGVSVFDVFHKGRGSRRAWVTHDARATNWQNGDTNRLAIVAQETLFTLYVNGQFTQQESNGEFQAGGVAFAALSESGTSICTFNNGWLWILD